jgi:hypothetical protein
MASTSEDITAEADATTGVSAAAHAPSLAGSVIEAKDGMGGSNFIRIQNMSATGTFYHCPCRIVSSANDSKLKRQPPIPWH